MAAAFNLTAQINLQGPNNLKPIVSKIKKDLGSIKTTLNLDIKAGTAKNIGQISRSLNTLAKAATNANTNISILNGSLSALAASFNNASSSTSAAINSLNKTTKAVNTNTSAVNQARTSIEEFGKQSGLAIKRFAAFSSVTTVVYGFLNALNSAFKEFVVFNQEIVRLSQVTNRSVDDLKGVSQEITRLSTGLGVASSDLLKVTTTLAQAGFTAEETKTALEALAKSALAPSFENIADTTEGAIAAMRQFGIQASELDSALGSINAVAAAFAVEAGDIITAIQRTGGVFAASSKGVSEGTDALNEFIAVFTSIRATTRESAETIATGLRTIFTRIQRSSTIQLLKDYGVELRDLEGKFVGPYEAVKRLSEGLNRLDPRSAAFAAVSEELGGFRQIGKVIPLIQQFATAQDALKIAQRGQGSLAKDAVSAQQALAVQFNRTRESFLALIRDIGDTNTFKAFTSGVFLLTNGLISLVGALKPVLPLLLTFAAIKIGGAVREYSSGFLMGIGGGGGRGGPSGGPAGTPTPGGGGAPSGGAAGRAAALLSNTSALTTLNQSVLALNQNIVNTNSLLLNRPTKGFASGGLVPGVGNSDSVSARLTPGEFVIRKKAVEAIGAGNLQRMNKYQWGGKVAKLEKLYPSIGSAFGYDDVLNDQINDTSSFVEVKPEQLSKKDINKWKRSKNKSWKKFEDLLERSFGVGKSAGGSGSKWSLLDFPYTRSEAKFMPKGSTYNDPDTIKGNNEATIAAKNYLFEQSTFKNKGNKPNLKVEELEKIQSLSPATVYWGDPKKFNSAGLYNLGGKIQKFVGGGKALGARPTVRQLDETELAQLSTTQLIKYANDLAYDLLSTAGAGMAIGSEFIEVPKEKIIPELESSLVSYMGKRGFWRETVAPFGRAVEQKIMDQSKLGREAALESQVSRYADEVAARSQEWASIRSGSSIDSYLMSALQDPILSDYKSAREGKPLAKAFHQTRLRKAVNEALDSFDDFDYSGAKIDKLVSGMAAKRFGRGGKASSDFTGYHGSAHIFSKIDASKLGRRGANLYGAGFNMAMDRGMAESYAKKSGAVYPVTVKGGISDFIEANSLLSENPKALQSIQKIFKQQKIPVKGLEQSTFRDASNKLTERLLEQIEKNLPNKPGVDANSRFMEAFGIASQKVRELMVAAGIPGVKVTTDRPLDEQMAVAYDLERIQLGKPLKSKRFASGGSVEDTVPALLTPGEFVINKKAAQRIGYGKLRQLNHADKIQGFNKGGAVGVQRFAQGGNALSLDKAAVVAAITSILLPEVQRLAASFAKLEGTAANFGAALGGAVREASSLVLSAGFSLQAVGATKGQVAAAQVGGFIGGAVGGALTDGTAKAMEKALLKNTESLGKFSKNLEDLKNAPTEELRLEASKRLEESFYNLDSSVRASIPAIENMEKLNNLGKSIGTLTTTVLTITTAMIALRAATNSMARSAALAAIAARQAGNAGAASAAMGSLGLARGLGRAIPYVGLALTAASVAYEAYSFFSTSIKSTGQQLNKLSEALEETTKNAKGFSLSNIRYSQTVIPNFRTEIDRLRSTGMSEMGIKQTLGKFNVSNEFNLLFRQQLRSSLGSLGIGIGENETMVAARSRQSGASLVTFDRTVAEVQRALTIELFKRAKKQEGLTDEEANQLLQSLGEGSVIVRATAEEYAGSLSMTKISTDELAKANNTLKISLVSLNNVLSLTESSFQKILTRTTNQFNDLDRTISILTAKDTGAAFTGGEFIRRDIQTLENLPNALPQELDALFARVKTTLGVSDQNPEQKRLFDQLTAQTKGLSVIQRSIGAELTRLAADANLSDDQIASTLDVTIGQSLRAALGPQNKDTVNRLLTEVKSGILRARTENKNITSLEDLGPEVTSLLESIKTGAASVVKSLDSVAKTSDLLSEQQKKLLEEEENLRQIQIQRRQTELKRDIDLRKSLGEDIGLKELNNVFFNEIKSLTAGLNAPGIPAGGTLDVETINNAILDSRQRLNQLLQQEPTNPQAKLTIETEKRKELAIINALTKAMSGLADQSVAAQNTLEEIGKQRDLFKSRREVLIDFIKGSFDPAKALQQRSAVESILLAKAGQALNPQQLMTFLEGGGRQYLEAVSQPGEADKTLNDILKKFGMELPPSEARDFGVQFIDQLGFAIPKLQKTLDSIGEVENRAQKLLDQPLIDAINLRLTNTATIFENANNSFKTSFGGIIQFFQDLGDRFSNQMKAPIREQAVLPAGYVEALRQQILKLTENRIEVSNTGGPYAVPRGMGVAATTEQITPLLQKLSGNTGPVTPQIAREVIQEIARIVKINQDTGGGAGIFGGGFDAQAIARGRKIATQFLEPAPGKPSEIFNAADAQQRFYNDTYDILKRAYDRAIESGVPEPLNPNFPTPLSIDTTKFDNTVNSLVAAFTSDNNNITQLATTVSDLGKVTDGLRGAIEEFRKAIPDGKIAMNIEQKSNVTVEIPDPVEVRSTSMRLDNRDSEALAMAIGNGLKDSIGSVFKFANLG